MQGLSRFLFAWSPCIHVTCSKVCSMEHGWCFPLQWRCFFEEALGKVFGAIRWFGCINIYYAYYYGPYCQLHFQAKDESPRNVLWASMSYIKLLYCQIKHVWKLHVPIVVGRFLGPPLRLEPPVSSHQWPFPVSWHWCYPQPMADL